MSHLRKWNSYVSFCLFALIIPQVKSYCLNKGFGLSYSLRRPSSLLALCSAGLQGSLKQGDDISPLPQKAQRLSPEPHRGDTVQMHTHTQVPSHTLSDPSTLSPAPCIPLFPHLLLLVPSEDRSCIELETMLVLSEELPALTST